ncbi:MAG: copper transporter [Akkermansiaceae bacterium]|nr:copper transporter [Akkermansiaceae bacterium]
MAGFDAIGIPKMHYDVLILGGGFGGAYCAQAVGKAFKKDPERRIGLVAERNVMVFQPMLAEVAGASLSPLDVVNPLRQFCRDVDVLQGIVRSVDWATKTVTLDGGRFTRNHKITFGHLVLAMGSVTDLSRVPGMAENGWPMKSVADAMRIRSAVINRLEEANLIEDEEVQRRLLTFVIVGGGYTGVETAGQLLDLINDAKEFYQNVRDKPTRVVLIHSRAHLLEEIGPELGDHAQKVLQRRGMEVILNARVTEATGFKIIYDNGKEIETHTIVSSIGNAPNPVILDLCKQLGLPDEKGRIATADTMRVPGHDNLWAIGDCAAVPWNDNGTVKTAPPTAQLALRQGRQVGENVARALRTQPLKPFTYTYQGQLATVGANEAVAEIMGHHFSGFIAWFMWRTIYLAKLPGFARKLRVMIDWTFELIFPRDLSVPLPVTEDPILPVHFQEGETLVECGDLCRAFLYVRTGTIVARAEGQADIAFAAGQVIDQNYIDATGHWTRHLIATERTDAVMFRGRLLEMLRTKLRLVPQPPTATVDSTKQ